MPSDRIRPPNDKATYLATLYGKAMDATAAHPILGDRLAADAVARLDCDFAALKLPRGADVTLPLRARHFDQWTQAFLSTYRDSIVLHIGCGLDTRVYRVDPGLRVRWFDVDLPEVIALRDQLYPDRPGYRRIATSLTDPRWLDELPAQRPVLVVAEGVLMYLQEQEGTA